jgi:hypothetical protein
MFWDNKKVDEISALVVDDQGKCQESGYSMAMTLRSLQYVARNGWDNYVDTVLHRNKSE